MENNMSDMDEVTPIDSVSNIGSRSSNSSHTIMRVREEQAMAEIKVEVAALGQQYELELRRKRCEVEQRMKAEQMEIQMRSERQRLDDEMKISRLQFEKLQKEFQLKTRLAVSEAKTEILERYELGSDNKSSSNIMGSAIVQHASAVSFESPIRESLETDRSETACRISDPKPNEIRPVYASTPRTMNVQAEPFQPQNSELRLAVNQDFLPRMEPDIFGGDMWIYPQWINSFETIIESRVAEPSQRLYYLSKYTTGEAKEAIQGLLCLKSSSAYTEARNRLDERYGNKYTIYETFRQKIRSWSVIKAHDGHELRRFSDFLCNCQSAMESIDYLRVLDDAEENQKIVAKLPRYMVESWKRVVDSALHGRRSENSNATLPQYPSFASFCEFLKKEARIACGPIKVSWDEKEKKDDKDSSRQFNNRKPIGHRVRSLATHTDKLSTLSNTSTDVKATEGAGRPPSCSLCNGQHYIDKCPDFLSLNLKERMDIVKSKMLCIRCLKWGHIRKNCRSRNRCDTCGRGHSSTLHDDSYQPNVVSHRIEAASDNLSNGCFHSLILTVYLHHKDNPQKRIVVYALLDPQSNACFISETTMKTIGVNGSDIHMKLKTMSGETLVSCQRIKDLAITDMSNSTVIDLPECFSRDDIAAHHDQIPRPETIRKWPHLRSIESELHPIHKTAEIGLLIGMNVPSVMKPKDCIPGKDNDPYAIKTVLGWGVIGFVGQANETQDSFCRTVTAQQRKCHFVFKTHAREISTAEVVSMYTEDFNERRSNEKISMNDKKFLIKLEHGIHQRPDGHMEMPLPMKEEELMLPNNRSLALKRLFRLKNSFRSKPKYANDYMAFMKGVIDKKHAERVPTMSEASANSKLWYLPHHGVYHPRKPDKLRVVFDCSSVYQGESLNQHLLQGPDQINSLAGILCRFRKEPEAFCCDIEAMFHQVAVNPEDRDYLRFLWWEDGKLDKEPVDYRMTVHLFGATSSPGCANYALRHTANCYEQEFGTETADFVCNDFYVDDGLKSVNCPEKAAQLIESSYRLCEKGGFNLTKFISNNKSVLKDVSSERHAKKVPSMNLLNEELPLERTLGVQWCLDSDTFQFKVVFQDKPLTRRGILSSVSSIFDPLGLLSPVTLIGKRILQDLCREGVDWDEPVSDEVACRWNRWKEDVTRLSELNIPRCYKPKTFGLPRTVELHHFSDASLEGYGECSYLRLIDDRDQIATSLVMAKARVTPSKSVTVPRLELAAAVVAVNVSSFLEKELKYDSVTNIYWSDSKVVLGYIANESKRFHIYVANRVQKIRDHSTPDQWRHVDTKCNPADMASRGLSADKLFGSDLWWKGPPFLASLSRLPGSQACELPEDDPEIRKGLVLATEVDSVYATLTNRLEYFSSWYRAKRAIGVCLRFLKKMKNHEVKRHTQTKSERKKNLDMYVPVDVGELQSAEDVIIAETQRSIFMKEMSVLQGSQANDINDRNKRKREMLTVNQASSLTKLDPYVDDAGVLRVGGRIRKAHLAAQILHPIILPRKSYVTRLIVLHYHQETKHSGRGITLNMIRSSGYWIIHGRTAVREHIRDCITCRKLRGCLVQQRMGDLPEDRLEATEPFTYSAVDLFGPFYVKQGRSQVKRYGTLFTCLASRAVHIEVAHTLSTDSFINAYRRFVCRRGPVRQLRSDKGTNFVGATNELQRAIEEMDDNKIRQELLKENCDWITFEMNVPYASHMGGAWERMIRSVRSVLHTVLDENGHDELLGTLMAEAEAIVNSRPLTYNDMNSSEELEPLSPYQILVLKSKVVAPPPGEFIREDLYCRRRWRRVQYLANIFWTRWKKEYMLTLQQRNKWTHPSRNLQEGDIVLVTTEGSGRGSWPMARVVDTYPGDDGLVRKVKVAIGKTYYDRPVQKLILIIRGEFTAEEPL